MAITMDAKYFLLNGGSIDMRHEGWFEIGSHDLDIANVIAQAGGGRGAADQAEFGPLGAALSLGSGLTDLPAEAAAGTVIRSIKTDGVTAGESPQTVLQLKLGEATVGQVDDGNGAPTATRGPRTDRGTRRSARAFRNWMNIVQLQGHAQHDGSRRLAGRNA